MPYQQSWKAGGDTSRVLSDLQEQLADNVEAGKADVTKEVLVGSRQCHGIRATNKSAAMDGQQTANAIGEMGTYQEQLGLGRSKIVQLQIFGLRTMSKEKKAAMSYENYKYNIHKLKGCEIVNWPADVNMMHPSKMAAVWKCLLARTSLMLNIAESMLRNRVLAQCALGIETPGGLVSLLAALLQGSDSPYFVFAHIPVGDLPSSAYHHLPLLELLPSSPKVLRVGPGVARAVVACQICNNFKAGRIYWCHMLKAEHTQLLKEHVGSGSSGKKKGKGTVKSMGQGAGKGKARVAAAESNKDEESDKESKEGNNENEDEDEDECTAATTSSAFMPISCMPTAGAFTPASSAFAPPSSPLPPPPPPPSDAFRTAASPILYLTNSNDKMLHTASPINIGNAPALDYAFLNSLGLVLPTNAVAAPIFATSNLTTTTPTVEIGRNKYSTEPDNNIF
ncbi:hypothetical protein B0H17DRAFT_1126533 [Mycena rosella]|uniref:Uncharacterized protein n=1 Tax=Mycena rosella TaxID=1033263 RepID=A0AAD7GTK8_MYCRO|nr:hypothetical protein B0H17DRAFT_1126533 [Mycena rosella]